MLFRVENLGPLREAEVDLSKSLIVLTGPNNSGKTHLASSVYGLHRPPPLPPRAAPLPVFLRLIRQLMGSPEHAVDLGDASSRVGQELLDSVAEDYRSRLHECFGAKGASFAAANVQLRAGDPFLDVRLPSLRSHQQRLSDEIQSALVVAASGSMRIAWGILSQEDLALFRWAQLDNKPVSPEALAATTAALASLAQETRDLLELDLGSNLHSMVMSALLPPAIPFPAERASIGLFARELAQKRTELPWPIRDSLGVAGDLSALSKQASPFSTLADEIENAVLGGRVGVADGGEMIFLPAGHADAPLEMHLASSAARSLAGLVFYFRHLANEGDFLVIDEPELGLHPDNQRKVTRILAKAVRLGFKVMMSTHGDHVLRELDQLLAASKLPDDETRALAPDKIGVYLLDGQHAEPVPAGETGFSIRTTDG